MSSQVFELLKSRIASPLVLIDVGSAFGVMEQWRQFGDKAKVFCFDAREDEVADLNAGNADAGVEYIPLALAEDDRGFTLNVTQGPGCSSVYTPVAALYERYPTCDVMRPIKQVSCPSTTLDRFLESRGVEVVDAIKLDTQGFELNIFRGAERALRHCKLIHIEVEFNALYEDQPLFCDIDRFLRDRGFVLWRLGNLEHYSTGVSPGERHPIRIAASPGDSQVVEAGNGQLFWADAVYVRAEATPVARGRLPFADAVASAALASLWNFWDLVSEMILKSGDGGLLSQVDSILANGEAARSVRKFGLSQDLSPDASHAIRDILGMLRPHRVAGLRKTRIGRAFDGGYVMLDALQGVDAAYSFGVNGDVWWAMDLARRGIPAFHYDQLLEDGLVSHGLLRWRRLGLGHQPQPARNVESLENLLAGNGHDGAGNLLLKCNAEGGEWGVFSNVPNQVLRRFSQIVVEFHYLQDLWKAGSAEVARNAMSNLTASHQVVHVHGNNLDACAVVGGIPFPATLQVTFARRDLGGFVVSEEVFPTDLDMPCDPRAADHFLGRFEFGRASPGA